MLAVTKVLLGDPLQPLGEIAVADRSTAKTISDVRRAHSCHWSCFCVDETPGPWTSTSRRTSYAPTQKKRKRKDSDGEYTPHQKTGNSSSSAVRRASKRLDVESKRQPFAGARPRRFATKRSSSSTSATTSDSFSSFDHPTTPKGPDTSDLFPSTSKLEQSLNRSSSVEYDWSDDSVDPYSSPPFETSTFNSAKIGFPAKEKKIVQDRVSSGTTKVGKKVPLTTYRRNDFFRTSFDC